MISCKVPLMSKGCFSIPLIAHIPWRISDEPWNVRVDGLSICVKFGFEGSGLDGFLSFFGRETLLPSQATLDDTKRQHVGVLGMILSGLKLHAVEVRHVCSDVEMSLCCLRYAIELVAMRARSCKLHVTASNEVSINREFQSQPASLG